MSAAEITYDLEKLRAACALYGKLSNKTESEVIVKQSAKLAWKIWEGMRTVMPEKGSIRAERLAALERGGGIKIRPSVVEAIWKKYGKRIEKGYETFGKDQMTPWAIAVKKELGIRESARGFLAYSTPRPQQRTPQEEEMQRDLKSKFGFTLSNFILHAQQAAESKVAMLRWLGKQSGEYSSPIEGLSQPRQQGILSEAVKATTEDIKVYLQKKLDENARVTGF